MAQSSGISKIGVSKLKSTLLKPALTSNYICEFTSPSSVESLTGFVKPSNELITLSCSEASLPGSSVATMDITNDYHGVTEKHGYRRMYDDRADFQFYVDSDYKMIGYFESWIAYITGNSETNPNRLESTYNYRVQYPKDYRTNFLITKFERNLEGKYLRYQFIDAFPSSINSMPISYDASQLLKVSVSLSYSRYVVTSGVYSSKYTPARFDGANDVNDIREGDNAAQNTDPVQRSTLRTTGIDFSSAFQ
jgi:hypothetical protein